MKAEAKKRRVDPSGRPPQEKIRVMFLKGVEKTERGSMDRGGISGGETFLGVLLSMGNDRGVRGRGEGKEGRKEGKVVEDGGGCIGGSIQSKRKNPPIVNRRWVYSSQRGLPRQNHTGDES